MAVEHSVITDPNVHEPKGATTAAINTAYFSNGAGSGTWGLVNSSRIDTASIATWINSKITDATLVLPKEFWITGVIPDISTAQSILMSIPRDCTVQAAYLTLGGTIATANVAINLKNSAGTAMGTAASVLFTGSNKGDKYTITATTANALVGPTWIEVSTAGGSTNTVPLYVTVKCTTAS